jgi:hypothetical protein
MNISDRYNQIEYLGDSVHIGLERNSNQLYIFTFNGIEPENEICLEDDVVSNFILAIRKYGYKREVDSYKKD